jgi:hypothetical protein
LAAVDAILAKAGTDKTRILSVQIWLADISTFAEMNSVWDKWVPAGHTPARATGEAKLATPDYKVEVIVTVGAELICRSGGFTPPHPRGIFVNRRYQGRRKATSAAVEPSLPSVPALPSSTGCRASASSLPSSTPHWS